MTNAHTRRANASEISKKDLETSLLFVCDDLAGYWVREYIKQRLKIDIDSSPMFRLNRFHASFLLSWKTGDALITAIYGSQHEWWGKKYGLTPESHSRWECAQGVSVAPCPSGKLFFGGQFFGHRHSTYGLRKYQRLLHGVFCGKEMRGQFWKCWVNCGDIYFMTRILNNPSKILNSASWSVFVTSIKPLPTTNITHFISVCFIKTCEYRTITCESQLTLAKLQWVSV